jgi:hypothetical protein
VLQHTGPAAGGQDCLQEIISTSQWPSLTLQLLQAEEEGESVVLRHLQVRAWHGIQLQHGQHIPQIINGSHLQLHGGRTHHTIRIVPRCTVQGKMM